MDEFWRWAGEHWWLGFVAFGVVSSAVGGISKSLDRAAKRRHERRLETLRLKTQLKAAEIQARGIGSIAPTPVPQKAAQPASVPSNELLERLFAEHDEITARWLDYELDVAKLIAFPAMSDGRQPLTAAFLRAKKTADALRPASADSKVTEQRVTEYLDAVGNYAVAFEVAERDARRLRDSSFSPDERKRLDRAQHMLKVALDESATRAERQVAYKRVRDELEGLLLLSDEAVQVLEKKVAGELSAGPAAAEAEETAAQAAAEATAAQASSETTPGSIPEPRTEPERMPLRRDDPPA